MNAFKYELGLCYIPIKDKEYIDLPNIKDGTITDVIVTINDGVLSSDQYKIEDNKLIFVSKIQQDNVIKFKCTVSFNNRKVIIANNPNNTKALIVRKKDKQTLYKNTRYNLNLLINGEVFDNNFTTQLDPLYCDVKTIRLDCNDFSSSINDDDIITLLYRNSIEIRDRKEETDQSTSSKISIDEKYLQPWVRYKTDIDILYRHYIYLCNKYGTKTKETLPIKIEDTTKLPELEDLLSRYKRALEDIENNFYSYDNIATAVKAGKTAQYPLDSRVF